MKWNFKPMEIDQWIAEKRVPSGLNLINEKLNLGYFKYKSQSDPDLSKLVLLWQYLKQTRP